MLVESARRLHTSRASSNGSEQCLLLVRAPSDHEIYGAFRQLASRWRNQAIGEQLLIEGDVPLTAGLGAPAVPATLQKLLDADCEMIDLLLMQAHHITVTYVRSGGHAPFRQSYFDEVRVHVDEVDEASATELEAIFRTLFDCLEVVSHSALAPVSNILAAFVAKQSTTGRSNPIDLSSRMPER